MKIKTIVQKYRRFVLYALVGGINTGIDFFVFTLLHMTTSLSEGYCQAISYTAGVVSSFLLNQNVTFKDGKETRVIHQVIRFICVNAVSMLVGVGGIRALVATGLNPYVAKLIITMTVAGINYFGYKLLVFRVQEKH